MIERWTSQVNSTGPLAPLRIELREHLARHRVDQSVGEDVVLVLTELVSNAQHACLSGTQVTIAVECSPTPPSVAVIVENVPAEGAVSSGPLRPQMPGPLAERGRGLALVAVLATHLSIDNDADLTRVRAEFTRPHGTGVGQKQVQPRLRSRRSES